MDVIEGVVNLHDHLFLELGLLAKRKGFHGEHFWDFSGLDSCKPPAFLERQVFPADNIFQKAVIGRFVFIGLRQGLVPGVRQLFQFQILQLFFDFVVHRIDSFLRRFEIRSYHG